MLSMKDTYRKKKMITSPLDPLLTLANLKKKRKPRKRITPPPKAERDSKPLLTIGTRSRLARLKKMRRKPRVRGRASALHPLGNCNLARVMRPGDWSGRRCFIIGGGLSLRDFDWDSLTGELVIGINRAFEKCDPTINIFMDYHLWGNFEKGTFGEDAYQRWMSLTGLRVWWYNGKYKFPPRDDTHPYDIYVVENAGSDAFPFDNLSALGNGDNAGYVALNLACVLGANPIYLLGYDMKGRSGKQTWWHDGYKNNQGSSVYEGFMQYFYKAAPKIKKKGIHVVNLNPKSAMKCFDFGDSKKVIMDKPHITVSESASITAVTPTGDRPLPLTLCQHWMENQTVRPDQWLVIDDGRVPLKPTSIMDYVRREPRSTDPNHTLNLNLMTAIPHIKGDKILIIEDDEYYAPGYVKALVQELDVAEVAGIDWSKYYYLPTGGHARHANTIHASLAQTGFRRSFIPVLMALVQGELSTYLDIRMWRTAMANGHGSLFTDEPCPLYLGIKGLPGRPGIGIGHQPGMYKDKIDRNRQVLKNWIPNDDWKIYMDIVNGKLTEANCHSYFQNITGVTVCCNTKDLMERAYVSMRKFHPTMPVIIVDGSDPKDPCATYVKSLSSKLTTVVSLGYNIGHGRGMCMGISKVKTPYALVFDSDIEMLKSPVDAMMAMMELDTFGAGYIEKTGFDGYEYGAHACHKGQDWMPMLHPYFQLIDVFNYHKYHPYVHHGAPCYLTALDIHKRGLSNKIIKEFPGLGHSSGKGWVWTGEPREYIHHDPAGTRGARRRKGLSEIEEGWVIK